MFRIDRCVCTSQTFEELKALASKHRWDFEQLRRHTGCGLGCGLCVPYLRSMLRTGRTEFTELLVEGTGDVPRARPAARARATAGSPSVPDRSRQPIACTCSASAPCA